MKQIEHAGTIVEITKEEYIVELISLSACASCHAKNICNPSDLKSKRVNIKRVVGDDYKIGDQVTIYLKSSMGMKAVLIAYVIPVTILLFLLLYLSLFLQNELLSGLISITFVLGYFFIIYLFRNRLDRKFIFTIEHKT
jgi:sigma-E factor negative regulatory protein RseC